MPWPMIQLEGLLPCRQLKNQSRPASSPRCRTKWWAQPCMGPRGQFVSGCGAASVTRTVSLTATPHADAYMWHRWGGGFRPQFLTRLRVRPRPDAAIVPQCDPSGQRPPPLSRQCVDKHAVHVAFLRTSQGCARQYRSGNHQDPEAPPVPEAVSDASSDRRWLAPGPPARQLERSAPRKRHARRSLPHQD
jgi:hypothetical protein